MGRIANYNKKMEPNDDDILVGSSSDQNNKTKNFRVKDIYRYTRDKLVDDNIVITEVESEVKDSGNPVSARAVKEAIDNIDIPDVKTEDEVNDSNNPVSSRAVKAAIENIDIPDVKTEDEVNDSNNPVSSRAVKVAIENIDIPDVKTEDEVNDSNNPVSSRAVKVAIENIDTNGNINIDSISTTDTAEQLNALADGLYFANGAGIYNISISNPTTGVTVANSKTTVDSGYSVSFNKKGNVWSLASSVSIPSYELPTASTTVKGGAKLGSTLEVVDDVLNVKKEFYSKTFNDNRVLKVTNIDTLNNRFTVPNHGLTGNADRINRLGLVFANLNSDSPFSAYVNKHLLYAFNIDGDTFQVSLNSSNQTALSLVDVELSGFHFEVNNIHTNNISLNFDRGKRYEYEILGDVLISYSSALGPSIYNNTYVLSSDNNAPSSNLRYNNIDVELIKGGLIKRIKIKGFVFINNNETYDEYEIISYNPKQNTTTVSKNLLLNRFSFISSNNSSFATHFKIQNLLLSNGTVLKIYEI